MGTRKRNGEGTIIELKDGTFVVRLMCGKKPDGKPYIKSRRAKNITEARRKLKEIKKEFDAESKSGQLIFNNKTVGEYFNEFLRYKEQTISPTSYRRLESTVDTHIKPYYAYVRFNDLTSDMIQQRLVEMQEAGQSHSSVKKLYDALNGCFKYAITRGDLAPSQNPMIAVNMIPVKKFEKPNSGPRYLKNEDGNNERERFVAEALRKYKNGKYVYRYGTTMVFMLNTGLRESEMSALSYETVHPEENYIEVRDSAAAVKIDGHYKTIIRRNETKWDSGRYVPLNDTAREMLREMANQFSGTYVTSSVHGDVLSPLELTKTFNRICAAANITEDMKGVGAHCLRHTFATSLFEQGVDIKTISELLGHSSTTVTLNTYISVANKMKIRAVNIPEI